MAGRILLVEDDAMLRQDLSEVLEEEGYEVVLADNGRDALSIMKEGQPPDVVLLDLMTPELNGWQFREKQLADSRLSAVPVVLLSGTEDLARVAASLQVAGCVRKPYALNDILAVTKKYCGNTADGDQATSA